MTELGNIIGNLVRETSDMKQSLVVQGDSPAWFQRWSEKLNVYGTCKIKVNDIDSSVFILSHPIQCLLVETSDDTDGFFLVDEDEGYTESVDRVLNTNHIHLQTFENTTFIDEDLTTATVTTSSGRVDFDADEIFQSNTIAKNNVAYKTVRITPSGLYTNLTPYVSLNAGSTWNEVTFFDSNSFTNTSTDGIKVKVIASSDADGSDYLTKLKINYN
jgi:hypothetical protein